MANLAPGWTKISPYVFKPSKGKSVGYIAYRKRTGLCEICGESILNHPKCDACSALSGTKHWISCFTYRGHNLCGYCVKAWERLGAETTWWEFLEPGVVLEKKRKSMKRSKKEG